MWTNRTVTSREYKLMLRADRFHERRRAAAAFWSLTKFLVKEKQGNEVFKEQDEELRRVTWYLDTPGTELRAHGFVLRVREEEDEDKPFKVTLKYRDPDRYVAASQDLSCREKIKGDDDKFEEDILPPFSSKFARSVAFKTDELPELSTMRQAIDVFPGLAGLAIPQNTPIRVVHGFKAREVAHRIGQLYFRRMPVARAGASVARGSKPDFLVKCCLTFWYLLGKDDEWPLAAEFSFDYDLPEEDREQSDRLEHFAPEVVAGTNLLFRSLQKQVGWMDHSATTKTAYAFDAL
jgi:hypothetical protein